MEILFPAFQPTIVLYFELDVSAPAPLFECVLYGSPLSAVKPPPNEDPSAFAKLAAVTMPVKDACPFVSIVTPVPTLTLSVSNIISSVLNCI